MKHHGLRDLSVTNKTNYVVSMIDIVVNFDIYTIIHLSNICTHKPPFSNEAKPILLSNRRCTIVTTKKNEKHAND
jgi:hypothetical protein